MFCMDQDKCLSLWSTLIVRPAGYAVNSRMYFRLSEIAKTTICIVSVSKLEHVGYEDQWSLLIEIPN